MTFTKSKWARFPTRGIIQIWTFDAETNITTKLSKHSDGFLFSKLIKRKNNDF